jgi:hypothetical protein
MHITTGDAERRVVFTDGLFVQPFEQAVDELIRLVAS